MVIYVQKLFVRLLTPLCIIHLSTGDCQSVCVCVCVRVCVFVCISVHEFGMFNEFVYVCAFCIFDVRCVSCLPVYVCTHIYTHTQMHTHTHTQSQLRKKYAYSGWTCRRVMFASVWRGMKAKNGHIKRKCVIIVIKCYVLLYQLYTSINNNYCDEKIVLCNFKMSII